MMMRSIIPNAFVMTSFSRTILGTQRTSYIYFGQRQYQSVCAATKYHSSFNRNQYTSLDRRLLAPKPTILYQPISEEFHILQKYISYLNLEEESRCSSLPSSNSNLGNVSLLSKYLYSTSNDKDVKKSCEDNDSEEVQKKLTIVQRFKAMLKDYWHVLIPVHVITSIGWFGAFYYLATSGMDIPSLMESLNFSEAFVKPFRDSSMGYIAVAYGLYKIATPARYTVTVGGTSIAIRVLKKRGLVQPWPISFKWLKGTEKKTRNRQ